MHFPLLHLFIFPSDYECHGLGHDDYLVANLGSIENARELQFSGHSSSSKNQRSDARLRPPWRLHNATPRNSPMTLALPQRTFWRLLTMLGEHERHNHLGALQNKKIELKLLQRIEGFQFNLNSDVSHFFRVFWILTFKKTLYKLHLVYFGREIHWWGNNFQVNLVDAIEI